jgi:hypothetical protein
MKLGRKLVQLQSLCKNKTSVSNPLCCVVYYPLNIVTFTAFRVKGITTKTRPKIIRLQARGMRSSGRRPARPRNLLLVYSTQTGSGVHPASFSVYSGVLSSAVKRPSSTEIKKIWSYASILTCLYVVVRGRNVPFTEYKTEEISVYYILYI